MKCEDFEMLMNDFFENTLNVIDKREFEKHVTTCERCKAEFNSYDTLYKTIANSVMELPDESLKVNFYFMLQSEINKEKVNQEVTVRNSSRRIWSSAFIKVAASIAILITGSVIGYFISQKITSNKYAMQSQTNAFADNSQNKILQYTMLHEESPGDRIKAVNNVENSDAVDSKILNSLIFVLNNDKNVNVRLAAAYTLSKYLNISMVCDSMVNSLEKQEEPILQVMLMNILTEKMEKKAIEPMQKIIESKKTMEQVKYAAQKNIEVLL